MHKKNFLQDIHPNTLKLKSVQSLAFDIVVELTGLNTKDVNIEKLSTRLSIIKGGDGNPALRIDPVYNEANKRPLLTDLKVPA